MRKLFISITLSLVLSVGCAPACFGDKTLNILYSGNIRGQITPVHGWGGATSGGLARTSTYANWIRQKEGPALLLDCGGILPTPGAGQRMVSEISLKAMDKMDYTAGTLGWTDLFAGADFLKEISNRISFPMVTSNLVYKDSQKPFGKKYLIREIADLRVGILGVMPSESAGQKTPADVGCSSDQEKAKGDAHGDIKTAFADYLEVIPPEDALRKLLPEVRSQVDFLILLSQCEFKATNDLVRRVKGIDLAISGQRMTAVHPDQESEIPVMEATYQGKSLGFVKLTLDDTGKIIHKKKELLRLGDSVPFDTRISKITGDDIHAKVREEEMRKMKKESEALMKLTPQEYYELLKKQQSGTGGKHE